MTEDLGDQAGDLRGARRGRRCRRDPGHQHQRPVGGGHRPGDPAADAGHRPALLQPGAGHGARRGGRDRADGRRRSRTGPRRSWRAGARPSSAARIRPGSSSIVSTARSRSRRCAWSSAARRPVAASTRALRGVGFPLGPFELMDLVGLDVNLAAATGVWDGLGRPERSAPVADPGRAGRGAGSVARPGWGSTGTRRERHRSRPPRSTTGRRRSSRRPIVARIRDAIERERRTAIADGVATGDDIDLALRLGAGHPPR